MTAGNTGSCSLHHAGQAGTIMKLFKFLKQPTAADIRDDQILEADRNALQYEASAEEHEATARQH